MTTLKQSLDDGGDILAMDIDFSNGARKTIYPASLFLRDDRELFWVDVSWPDDPDNAFHVYTGTLEGGKPWTFTPDDTKTVKSITIRELVIGEPATEQYLYWGDLRSTPGGNYFNRQRARQYAVQALGLKPDSED